MEEKAIALRSEFVVALINYLDSKPHGEVRQFIDEMSKSPQLDVADVKKLLEKESE